MSRLAPYALLTAAGLSAIALTDAVTYGLTGRPSLASDEFGVSAPWAVSGLVHVAAYLVLAAVLVTRGRTVDRGSRLRRVIRWSLVASLLYLGAGMLVQTVLSLRSGQVLEPSLIVGVLIGVAFLTMFLASAALGLTLLRSPGLRSAAWTLTAVIPALGVAILLGVLGSPFAHPAYPEVASAVGLALIALAPRREAAPAQVSERATAAGDGWSRAVG